MPLNCCISFTELNQKQNPAAKNCPKHEQSGSSIDFLNEIAAISTILAISTVLAILTLILAILAHSAHNWPILTVAKYHGSAAGYKMERTEKKRENKSRFRIKIAIKKVRETQKKPKQNRKQGRKNLRN